MTSDDTDRTVVKMPGAVPVTGPAVGHFLSYVHDGEQRRVVVGPAGVTIGRAAPSDLLITVPDISRRHCRIDVDGEWAEVTDLNSTNGTFVGGERIGQPARLRNDSLLSLGTFHIRYERRDPREVAQEEELVADLRRAADYVRAILPSPIPDGPVRADWHFVPSAQLGGDAFGYQFLDENTFAGFVLDVSGHGIGSAMHAANVANAIRRRALPGVDFRDPAQVAAGLNDVFPMEEHNDLMLTLWYFVYDLHTRTLRYSSAGHHASCLVVPGSTEPVALISKGAAIGMLPLGRWVAQSVQVPPGGRLYVFSDGVFEIKDYDGREWGLDDLRHLIASPSGPGPMEPNDVWQAIRAATPPGPLEDDFSILTVTFC